MTTWQRREPYKPPRPPVKHVTLDELFIDLSDGGKQLNAERQAHRDAGASAPAPRTLWRFGDVEVRARTKSEARALVKGLKKWGRLPPGHTCQRVSESNKEAS